MADDDDELGDGDEAEFEASPRPGRKKLILIIGAVAAVLLLGGGFGVYKMIKGHEAASAASAGDEAGAAGQDIDKTKKAAAHANAPSAPIASTVFYDLPDMLVNIDAGSRRKSFLKLKLSVELDNEADIPKIESVLPKIIDNFQIYLRDLKPDQLEGAAGAFRIREELLVRVNAAVRPVQVRDVLLKDMLLQ
jgi:flagellar FliL protein